VFALSSFATRARAGRPWPALLAALLAVCLVACASNSTNAHVNVPPPVESTAVGPTDVFHMEIIGEKDLPDIPYQVASDGTVDLPYVHRVKVSGLEPQQIADLVRKKLMSDQILTNPTVVVTVTAYNSKQITVLGQVQKPGAFPFMSGMTLIQAISLAGGLNAIAASDHVNLTRKTKDGYKTVELSIDAITSGRSPDIPLQAGDQIFVNERIF
jgi:polysaccharide biosynthesis/export protein VpsN